MSTPFTEFYESIRHILGDNDPNFQMYGDAALQAGMRTILRMGRISGYTLDPDLISITPEVTDPNVFALIVYRLVKSYVISQPDTYSYATRALKETFGGWQNFLWEIEMNLNALESGSYFDNGIHGWQTYYSWVEGLTGLPFSVPFIRVNPGTGPRLIVAIPRGDRG